MNHTMTLTMSTQKKSTTESSGHSRTKHYNKFLKSFLIFTKLDWCIEISKEKTFYLTVGCIYLLYTRTLKCINYMKRIYYADKVLLGNFQRTPSNLMFRPIKNPIYHWRYSPNFNKNKNCIIPTAKPNKHLIFKGNNIKIIDFGSATLEETSNLFFGSIQYQPPQVALKEKYSKKFDVFSSGVLFWEIQQFGLKFDDVFIEQFNNVKYPNIDAEDYLDLPWLSYNLKEKEKQRLTSLEVFVNMGETNSRIYLLSFALNSIWLPFYELTFPLGFSKIMNSFIIIKIPTTFFRFIKSFLKFNTLINNV